MNKCPNCEMELQENSSICPHCDTILADESITVDDELEKFSKMIQEMENESLNQTSAYSIGDFDKTSNGELEFYSHFNEVESKAEDGEVSVEASETTVEAENIEKSDESLGDGEVTEINEVAPIVFSASKKGVKKITEDPVETLTIENLEVEEEIEEFLSNGLLEEEIIETSELEETEVYEPKVVKNPFIDELVFEDNVDIRDFFDDSLESEEELDKLFDEISSYSEELNPEIESYDDELDLEERIRGGLGLTGSEVEVGERSFNNKLISTVNTVEELLKKSEIVENIDKKVRDFLLEVENIEDTPLDKNNQKIKSDTYLKLNFVTTDKFATLITSENERFDIDSDLEDENIRFTNIHGIDTIIIAENLTDEELQATIAAVNIQKDEIISSLEQEEKALLAHKYIEIRYKMLRGLKLFSLGTILILIYYFGAYMFDVDLIKVESSVYSTDSVEKYDEYIYSGVLDIRYCTYEVNNKFKMYLNGEITDEQMLQICYVNLQTVSKYSFVFGKDIYEEASNYTFQALNAYFFSTYFIDNIIQYVNTKDEYYLELNEYAISQDDDILREVEDARIQFLMELGYTDEEIGIMTYKARN